MIPFTKAKDINTLINNTTKYRCDIERYSLIDFWETANGEGDCEDFALAKRKELFNSECLWEDTSLATCWTEINEYHAVLLVNTDKGTFVLDNRFQEPMPKSSLKYRWHKIEMEGEWYELS